MKISSILRLAIADSSYPGDKIEMKRNRHLRIQWTAFSCMSFWAMEEMDRDSAMKTLKRKKK